MNGSIHRSGGITWTRQQLGHLPRAHRRSRLNRVATGDRASLDIRLRSPLARSGLLGERQSTPVDFRSNRTPPQDALSIRYDVPSTEAARLGREDEAWDQEPGTYSRWMPPAQERRSMRRAVRTSRARRAPHRRAGLRGAPHRAWGTIPAVACRRTRPASPSPSRVVIRRAGHGGRRPSWWVPRGGGRRPGGRSATWRWARALPAKSHIMYDRPGDRLARALL